MTKHLFVFVNILFLFALCSVAEVNAQEYNATYELNLYAPAKITIQFVYTENFTLTNVKTLGGAIWTEVGSPVSLEFHANDIDTYSFDVILLYKNRVQQTIQIGIWSGTIPPHALTAQHDTTAIRLHFKLIVATQPRPPTPNEVASAVVMQMQQYIQWQTDQITILTREFENNLYTMWIIIAISSINSLFCLIISLYVLRKVKK